MDVKIVLLVCLSCFFLLCSGIKTEDGDRRVVPANALQKYDESSHSDRRKRGIGSILVFGTSILLRTTSLGLTIAQAATDGCAIYRSICTDKDEIERLDTEIKSKKSKFDVTYYENGRSFVDLRQASLNNEYIAYYTNKTIREIETIENITERIVEKLTLKDFPEFAKLAAAIKNNVSSEKYLEMVVGQIEFSLSDIKKMLEQTKQNQLIGTAIQFLSEILIQKFMNAYSSAYGQIAEDIFAQSQIQNLFNDVDPSAPTKISFMKKVKLIPKVLKRMGKNTAKYFKDSYVSLKKWKRIKSWKGFKGKFKHSLRKPIQKFTSIKRFVTNSAARRNAVKNFNLKWSQRISMGLGIVADAVSIALNLHQWKKVADEMRKAKDSYVEYNNKLTSELQKIQAEESRINEGWQNTTSAFKEVSKSILQLFTDLAKNADFNDVVGLPSLPVDFSSKYFPRNFDDVVKSNLLSKQQIMLNFLRNMNGDFEQIREELDAKMIMYDEITEMAKKSQSVSEILDSLKTIYHHQQSPNIQKFENQISKKDIVCVIAERNQLMTEYDFFALSRFRDTSCGLSATDFNAIAAGAKDKRNKETMLSIVKSQIETKPKETLDMLFAIVKNTYTNSPDADLKAYANSITQKAIVCSVATVFPSMPYFDDISLAPFRPSCDAVSDASFQSMLQAAQKNKALTAEVEGLMNICDQYKYCPCIETIVQTSTNKPLTADDVKRAIKKVRPSKTEYCGVTGCQCVSLG